MRASISYQNVLIVTVCKYVQVAEDTPGILNCLETRQFWVRWEYNIVEAGTGRDVGANRIIHWSSVDPVKVSALSVSTGKGVTGDWTFSEYTCESDIGFEIQCVVIGE